MTYPSKALTDLNPNWISQNDRIVGIAFDCPVHGSDCDCPIGVYFANPPDGGVPLEGGGARWTRKGETFETLTLNPSIRVSWPKDTHWHGWVREGRVYTEGDTP